MNIEFVEFYTGQLLFIWFVPICRMEETKYLSVRSSCIFVCVVYLVHIMIQLICAIFRPFV